MTLEHVEVSEVGNMAQQHHCHVDFPFTCAMLFRGEGHGILFFHMYVRRERHHSQHGHAANILHHFSAGFKQPQITSEFVDNDTFDALAVILAL